MIIKQIYSKKKKNKEEEMNRLTCEALYIRDYLCQISKTKSTCAKSNYHNFNVEMWAPAIIGGGAYYIYIYQYVLSSEKCLYGTFIPINNMFDLYCKLKVS